MRFKEIIGHKEAIEKLRSLADSGKVPHALLLSGPTGIGKHRVARAFLQYLNCERRANGDSCGVCPSCRRIEKFSDPDIHYIYPVYKKDTNKPALSEDFLKEWLEMLDQYPYLPFEEWTKVLNCGTKQPIIYKDESDNISYIESLSPYADKYKVFFIWLPEKLQPAAANKLLKTLEEPQDDTLFICVSDAPQAILPTIYSRLQRIELTRPSDEEIMEALTRAGISSSQAPVLARLAEGNVGKAFMLASNAGETAEFSEYFRDAMRAAYARKVVVMKSLSEKFAATGREKGIRILEYFSRMVRENFIANLKMPVLNVMTREEEEFSYKFAPFINASNVEAITSDIDKSIRDISRNANGKIVWFDFLMRLMVHIRMQLKSK